MSPRLHVAGDATALALTTLLVFPSLVFAPTAIGVRILLNGYTTAPWGWLALALGTAAGVTATVVSALGTAPANVGLLWPIGAGMLLVVQLASVRLAHNEESPAAAGLSVGDTGLEPVTSCLSSRRSPS
jgi:hypothetical protein